MVTEKKWAVGSNQYVKRVAPSDRRNVVPEVTQQHEARRDAQLALTGVTWDPVDVTVISSSAVERARHRFRASFPELIWNAAALEGNTFTLPEVRTLLDGVTVGGKRTQEEQQILALSEAYSTLDELVGSDTFQLTKAVSDELHGIVAVHEAIESGHFRGQGKATGGGSVRLSSGGVVDGLDGGQDVEVLIDKYLNLVDYLQTLPDARERAIAYFAATTRRQFYFDGNKRTARLMMTGELLSQGYDPISVPYARRLEYNLALDRLFTTNDATELMTFLTTCTID